MEAAGTCAARRFPRRRADAASREDRARLVEVCPKQLLELLDGGAAHVEHLLVGAHRERRCQVPLASTGSNDRAGFMLAPVTGPPKIASSPTVPPIAIAAAEPTARVSVATGMITNIRKAVRSSS